MNISLSLFIKQIWKLAYLCIICIQMLKHKLQMTFHFMWFLSCHSSLSVKQFHTGKFILKLDQNVHILIFFEIFSAKKSRMNSLYWNVNRKRCSGFSFCLLSKTIFNLKFFMRLVARFMDRTQDCNITNTRLQLEWRKLHRLSIYAFPMRIFENSSKKTIPKSTTMEHIFERCLHTDLNFKCFSILLEIVQMLRQCKSTSIQTNCLPTISKMKCVKRAAKYRHLDTNVCKFWANDTMIGCGSHNMNISQQFSTLFNNFDNITIRMSLLGRISSFSNRFDWFWCHLRWKSMMVPT